MNNVIRISIIGASMVIIGLMLLWFLMDVLVRATTIKRKIENESDETTQSKMQDIDLEYKRKSAAASIAVAMVLLNTSFLSAPEHSTSQHLSAWQISKRNQQMANRLDTTFRDREKK